MAALIEALPPERRAAAWAGEAARLARWGQEARNLLPPPERALEDSLVPALAPSALTKTLAKMPVALRTAVQAPGWALATQAPAQRCELLRWWSQEQVRSKQLTQRQAMLAWRTALAPRSTDFLLTAQPRSGAEALDKKGFPLVAHSMALTGKVFVEQDIDASGKVLHAFVQRRELHSASLGKQVPLALEHELDQATLDRVGAQAPKAPDPATLRNGVATRRVGIEWTINR
jgi:outer membrane biosynthesis protein TonB